MAAAWRRDPAVRHHHARDRDAAGCHPLDRGAARGQRSRRGERAPSARSLPR
jgi:hypothetical protein